MNAFGVKDECHALAVSQLDTLAAVDGRAQAMRAFDAHFRSGEGRAAEDKRPRVGQLCNFLPEELVIACGCVPLRLDNAYPPSADSAAAGLPVDLCCAVRSIGALSDLNALCVPKVDLLVVPDACDGKRKLAAWLARQASAPRLLQLELPPRKRGDDVARWWRAQMALLVREMQNLAGRSLARSTLVAAVDLIQRRSRAVRALNALRVQARPPIHGADAFLVMQASFLADLNWWCEKTEALVDELNNMAEAQRPAKPRARLLLTGAPVLWPDFSLLTSVLSAGADVVADESCSGTNRLHHPVVIDERTKGGLIRAAGERTLLPCTCPCFAESEDRVERVMHLVRQFAVDGVLHHNLRLCVGFDFDSLHLSVQIKKMQVGWLALQAEFQSTAAESLRNRLEAFIETIE